MAQNSNPLTNKVPLSSLSPRDFRKMVTHYLQSIELGMERQLSNSEIGNCLEFLYVKLFGDDVTASHLKHHFLQVFSQAWSKLKRAGRQPKLNP